MPEAQFKSKKRKDSKMKKPKKGTKKGGKY